MVLSIYRTATRAKRSRSASVCIGAAPDAKDAPEVLTDAGTLSRLRGAATSRSAGHATACRGLMKADAIQGAIVPAVSRRACREAAF